MLQINIAPIPAQRFQVVLDGQYCTITIRQKGERIYLDLALPDVDICHGAICVNGVQIVQSPSQVFNGTLHFFDTLGDKVPYFEGINSRYVLLYLSEGEYVPEALRF